MPNINLDEVISVLSNFNEWQSKAEQAQVAADEANRRALDVIADAEKRSAEILQSAEQEARQKSIDVDAKAKGLTQREQDVTVREAAVVWVDAEREVLAQKEQQVNAALKDAEVAKSNALAEGQLWQTRQKELDDKAAVLEQRLLKLSAWEQRIRQGLPVTDTV